MRKPPSAFADGGETLVQKIAKFLAAAGVAQLAQGLGLNLADAFTRDVEFLSDFLKGAGPPVYDAESKLQPISVIPLMNALYTSMAWKTWT